MSDYYISGRSYEKEIGPLIQKIGEFVSAFYNINDIMQCLIEQVIHLWNNWIVLLKEQSVSKAFHALRQGLHHAWLPSQWRDLETFLTRSVWVTISAYSWSSIMGSPLVFITLISVTSSIFYLKILMNHFIEKNQILILGVYEFGKNLIQIQMYTILYNMPIVKEKKTIWISKLLYFQLQVQTNSESSTVLILDHTAGELHNKVMLTEC